MYMKDRKSKYERSKREPSRDYPVTNLSDKEQKLETRETVVRKVQEALEGNTVRNDKRKGRREFQNRSEKKIQ